ncbi:MAG TPA: hypothetical protein VFC23_13555 [Thermoanaerobaculia bacterium]|nr:hypothetical protein [Thermoanaerobaculia bacterium]
MSLKTAPLFSLRRLVLLVLAVVLTCLTLAPSAMACCAEGSTQIVYTSIGCCNDPRLPSRPGDRQTCTSCQWVTTSSGCFRASICAI